jgi:hypothetical protein
VPATALSLESALRWLDVPAALCAPCELADRGTVDAGPLVCDSSDRGVSALVCVAARAFGDVRAAEVDFHDELEQAQKSAVARTALYLITRPGCMLDACCDASRMSFMYYLL